MEAPAPPRHAARAIPLAAQVRRTLALAVPVMGSRLGLVLMITVDSVMAGQFSGAALAHYGISLAPHIFLLVVGIGLLVGTVVLVGQADGADQQRRCGAIWHSALLIAFVVGSGFGLLLLFGETILLLLGQSAEMAAGGGRALAWAGLGLPAILMYLATSFFLEGIGRARAGMIVALGANLPNAALNWVLIGGELGAPAMGAAGAMLATTISRWLMLAALIAYALTMRDRASYGVSRASQADRATVRRLLRLGAPLAAATGIESGAFATLATFAGWLGETQMAAYQACLNVVSFAFMLAIGLSTATSVRTANAVGRADRPGLALAGWLGLALAAALMLAVGVLVLWQREPIAQLYTDSEEVGALIRTGLLWVAAILLFDGAQGTLMGAHRGAADVLVPTSMQGFSFLVVGVPLAYYLGIVTGGGVPALLTALLIALITASILLSLRFAIISRRPVAAYY